MNGCLGPQTANHYPATLTRRVIRRKHAPRAPDRELPLAESLIRRPFFTWIQDDGRTFCLCDRKQTIYVTLQFERTAGSLATGKTSEDQWTFKRVGFFKPCISVRPAGQETVVAFFQRARLHFAGGRVPVWKPTKGPGTERGCEDQEGRRVVRLLADFGPRRYEAKIEIGAVQTRGVEISVALPR